MTPSTGPFEAVIFDFDGTIADSHAAMVRAYRIWCEQYGLDPASLEEFTGRPSAVIAETLVPEAADEAAARIDELEIADVSDVVALPGAAEAFAAIPVHRRAIATSCTAPLLEARLGATGLPRPEVVVTADQVKHGKPAPDPFLLAAERLGVDPARCLVCEDAPAGVAAARAAGMAVLGVLTTHGADKLRAHRHVATLAEVRFSTVPDGVIVT